MNKTYQKICTVLTRIPPSVSNGFTLIELLVVVLIIGILAAIALPQYAISVEKSRATHAIVAARALKDAQEVYYMTNGSYASSLDNLDIQIPDVDGFNLETGSISSGRLAFLRDTGDYYIVASGAYRKGSGTVLKNMLYCCPSTENGRKICRTVGSQQAPSNSHCSGAWQIF